jgi:hypothetical protein
MYLYISIYFRKKTAEQQNFCAVVKCMYDSMYNVHVVFLFNQKIILIKYKTTQEKMSSIYIQYTLIHI